MTCTVIAEAGVNHNGELSRALEMVDVAAAAGADVIKFQAFKAGNLASVFAPKAEYQISQTGTAESQLDMLRRLELKEADYPKLMERCRQRGIGFLVTPFDLPSIDFLVGLGLDTLKIPSGEITNGPLLLKAGRSGCRLYLSTGLASLGEVEAALAVLAFAYIGHGAAGPAAFAAAWNSPEGRAAVASRVTLLHCTTEYPAPIEDSNLRAMATLRQAFGLAVGLSDHTPGIIAAAAAVALGASVVEKHFTLDRNLPGPDHKASLEPAELAELCRAVRGVEAALGDGVKCMRKSEAPNRDIARKSLVALTPIAAGEVFSDANLGAKRPGSGISPMRHWDLLGKAASRAYGTDELIEED